MPIFILQILCKHHVQFCSKQFVFKSALTNGSERHGGPPQTPLHHQGSGTQASQSASALALKLLVGHLRSRATMNYNRVQKRHSTLGVGYVDLELLLGHTQGDAQEAVRTASGLSHLTLLLPLGLLLRPCLQLLRAYPPRKVQIP